MKCSCMYVCMYGCVCVCAIYVCMKICVDIYLWIKVSHFSKIWCSYKYFVLFGLYKDKNSSLKLSMLTVPYSKNQTKKDCYSVVFLHLTSGFILLPSEVPFFIFLSVILSVCWFILQRLQVKL